MSYEGRRFLIVLDRETWHFGQILRAGVDGAGVAIAEVKLDNGNYEQVFIEDLIWI